MFTSKTTKGYMQNFLLTEQEAYMAMLIAAGASMGEAYCVAVSNLVSKESADANAYKVMKKKPGIKQLVDTLTSVNMRGVAIDEKLPKGRKKKGSDDVNLRDKDCIIDILQEQVKKSTDPKTIRHMVMAASDLQRMKQEENKDEKELVHYYVPPSCHSCELYEKAKENINNENK